MTKEQELFLTILRHIIHGDQQELKKEDIRQNTGRILNLSLIHMIFPLVVDALYRVDPDILERYKDKAVQQAIRQAERTGSFILLYRKMQNAGLSPIVLKGIICRNLYTQSELRPSVDEDLLIQPDDIQRYHSFLLQEGYSLADPDISLEKSAEITYLHPDALLCLEVHKQLFPAADDRYGELNTLFDHPEEPVMIRIYDTDIKTLGYTDHFLYLICHAYKHVIYSGIGIRQFCDITLFAERYGQNIDWTAVYDSCRQMHLDLFLQAVLKICAVHLGMDENKAGYKAVITVQDVDEMPLLKDTLTGGIYGAQDENRLHSANMTLNAVSNKTGGKKHKWVTGLLFPSLSYMSHTYPYLKKHRYLLPVAWVQRIHTYLINKGKTNDPRKTVEIGKQRIEMLRKYNLS